ncbi:MAG: bifunctional DNA primase/polymerase [Pseudomonas sp.]|nr:bifunctional DNA primase/polymerase [Pseudomonas sp.]
MSEGIQPGLMAAWAKRYVDVLGLAVVPIPPGLKAPKDNAWNQPGGYFTDAVAAAAFWVEHPQHNMGAVLGPSGVCSLDVDDVPATRQVLADLMGLDVDAMADCLPTVVGNPERFRIMFRAPAGFELGRKALSWPVQGAEDAKKRFTVFELRHGLVQDVLPPSIHPGTGKPYVWRTPPSFDGLPELPAELLAIWQNWEFFKRDAEAACPWAIKEEPRPSRKAEPGVSSRSGGGESVIEAFNRAHDVEALLERHGYKRRGMKWLFPASSTGLPGVTVSEGRVFSHHAADPLANGHQNDAFDVFCLLEYGGDQGAAVKAAAKVLGLERPARAAAPAVSQSPPAATADDSLPRAPSHVCSPEPDLDDPLAPTQGGAGGFRISEQELLQDFVVIYGADVAWDCKRKRMVKLSAIREAVGRTRYKWWQESEHRRMAQDAVFDPTETCSPLMLNLFDGFPLKPSPAGKDGCALIRHHLGLLCGHRLDEYEFLVNWIAYPLQNPGAKMASSVVMFGAEGPGKSLLWELVVKRIYGDYGTTIGQAQLESQFTGWQSRKLFALAEEVVSREEMRHYKGVLKHLVSGNTLQINEKNMPCREEKNHLNMVFLSNSTLPMALDEGDRRYLVLYVDRVMPKEYFDELVAEIDNGGVEAFYQYLMERDLTGFSAHAKPPLNEEKQGLIDGSLPAPRYFVRRWMAGETDFPPTDAVHPKDLWKAFCRWCDGANEFRRRERDFHQEVARDLTRERVDIKYPLDAGDFKTTRLYVTKEFAARRPTLGRDWAGKVGIACRAFAAEVSNRLLPAGNES